MKKTEIQEKLLEAIKSEEKLPWRKEWSLVPTHNPISDITYKGVNIFLTEWLGSGCQEFMTFKQASSKGYSVKKDSSGIPIVFFNRIVKKSKNKDEDDQIIPVWKQYTVFKVWDIEGYEKNYQPVIKKTDVFEKVSKKIKLNFHKSNKAFYNSNSDEIVVPIDFDDENSRKATIYHEAVHSTQKALGRKYKYNTDFGRAMEELVAEIGASLLCGYDNIENTLDNHKAYIQSWSELLEKRVENFYIAFNQADKAVKYLLDLQEEK